MNKLRVIKYVLYVIEILLALLIQCTPYLLPEVYGGKAIVLLALALSISVFEPEVPSMIFAVICGVLADCSYSGPIGFYAIMFAVMCFIVSVLNENYIRRNLLTAMIEAVIAIPAIIFLQFLFYYIMAGYGEVWSFFLRHYISRIIYTLAFVPLLYGLNKFLSSTFRTRGAFK